ncbi:hypothetical protein K1719_016735 [Acacia pycnantha]|nr:hypothetical protein K1719_016735 [Acacia pycnantha]
MEESERQKIENRNAEKQRQKTVNEREHRRRKTKAKIMLMLHANLSLEQGIDICSSDQKIGSRFDKWQNRPAFLKKTKFSAQARNSRMEKVIADE